MAVLDVSLYGPSALDLTALDLTALDLTAHDLTVCPASY
jgi:hypothetical protein